MMHNISLTGAVL